MKDTGVCPHCRRKFEVTPGMYGLGTPCPCCRRLVNIFPDPKIYIHTSLGIYGVGLVKADSLSTVLEVSAPKKLGFLKYFNGVLKLFQGW